MLEETMEVQELSLEKVIETRLVQNNVTEQVLAALRDKYGNMKLKALDDKESYLELKVAAKDCAKVRNLVVKVCKEGREDAVRQQKLWVAKEKEVVSKVAEIESPLDAEIAKFDAEVQRKATEEKERQEAAYINRQATLTKMGAVYEAGNFVLGNASFEALLVKECSQDVWEEAVVPKYRAEYEIIEAEKAEKERLAAEEKAELQRQQEAFRLEQEEFRKQQAELQRQRDEANRAEAKRVQELFDGRAVVLRGLGMSFDGSQFDFADIYIHKSQMTTLSEVDWTNLVSKTTASIKEWKDAEAKRLEEKKQADIQAAIAEEKRLAEIRRLEEEAKRAEEASQASDKVKFATLISSIQAIQFPEMKTRYYAKKVQAIQDKVDEIIGL